MSPQRHSLLASEHTASARPRTSTSARGTAAARTPSNQRHSGVDQLRVIIAEDELITREWLASAIGSAADLEVVAACRTATELKTALATSDPDVIVTDTGMPPSETDEGLALLAGLRQSLPQAGVVVLSHHAEPSQVLAVFREGSARRGYLLKRELRDAEKLLSAIRRVADGDSVIDPKVFEVLIQARSAAAQSPLARLTRREREVLAHIAAGKSNRAIAGELVITPRAIEKHVGSIFFKLDLRGAEDASKRVRAALLFLAEAEATGFGALSVVAASRNGAEHCVPA
jgi:DNA-binding NarL/FixJ family response regulator